MLNVLQLRPELLAPLIPNEWSLFRPLILQTLQRFIERLPPYRQSEIRQKQANLPPTAAIPLRLTALLADCPTLHKLGQMIARDKRLPTELRTCLQWLERMAPTVDTACILQRLTAELGDQAMSELRLAERPLAEGSVAVVQPFSWRHPQHDRPDRGVFKVLKPGVERRLAEDLKAWEGVADDCGEQCESIGVPAFPLQELLEDVRELLAHEIQLDGEQQNLTLASHQFAKRSDIVIPKLLPYCTPRVTAMAYVDGCFLSDIRTLTPSQRSKLASLLVEGCFTLPLWTSLHTPIFHGDPHAGNLEWSLNKDTGQVQLVMLDWSLAAKSTSREAAQLARTFGAFAAGGFEPMCSSLLALGFLIKDLPALQELYVKMRYKENHHTLPKLSLLLALLDTAIQRGYMMATGFSLLIRKSLLTLQGVVGDVSRDFSLDRAVLALGMAKWISEWPARAVAIPTDDRFDTHLSNYDIWRLAMTMNLDNQRSWVQSWLSMFSAASDRR